MSIRRARSNAKEGNTRQEPPVPPEAARPVSQEMPAILSPDQYPYLDPAYELPEDLYEGYLDVLQLHRLDAEVAANNAAGIATSPYDIELLRQQRGIVKDFYGGRRDERLQAQLLLDEAETKLRNYTIVPSEASKQRSYHSLQPLVTTAANMFDNFDPRQFYDRMNADVEQAVSGGGTRNDAVKWAYAKASFGVVSTVLDILDGYPVGDGTEQVRVSRVHSQAAAECDRLGVSGHHRNLVVMSERLAALRDNPHHATCTPELYSLLATVWAPYDKPLSLAGAEVAYGNAKQELAELERLDTVLAERLRLASTAPAPTANTIGGTAINGTV